MMAKRHYELHVAGCTRQLPVINISDTLAIAGFVILGDTEIVENCAKELAAKVPGDTDIIMTAETKGIPLAHELASALGMKRYIVARKSVKAYMETRSGWRMNPLLPPASSGSILWIRMWN